MKKTYKFNYDFHKATANFEVDLEKFTKEMAMATLDFFSWDYDKEADPIDEVMNKYALRAIEYATINYHNTFGVKSDFENAEGFGLVDGSIGVTLTYVEGIQFEDSELEVEINKIL